MLSKPESPRISETASDAIASPARANLVRAAAACWGLSAFFPIGVMYLNLLLLLLAMGLAPDIRTRLAQGLQRPLIVPIAFLICWTVIAALAGDWHPDTATRLFHVFRVALVLVLGMMLTAAEARTALAALLLASVAAALVVAAHHIWGLPEWRIWASLLSSRNNFSSGNMITMASAFGICLMLALRGSVVWVDVLLWAAAALALGVVVALHAVSRNAHIVLVALSLAAVLYRFRTRTAFLGGPAAVLLIVLAMWQLSPMVQVRFSGMARELQATEAEADYSTSVGVRLRMYQEASRGMAANPVFGTGVGSWLPHWRSVSGPLAERLPPEERRHYREINNPHNDFLLAGMETGVPGLLAMAWLMLAFVRQGWSRRDFAGGVTVVLAVTLICTALVNAPFRDAALGMTLLWLLGVSVAGHRVQAND